MRQAGERTALVLQGGGARGGYQVGVIKALAEIAGRRRLPFQIICGASVGSINAAAVAMAAHDFPAGARHIEDLWLSLRCNTIYDTRALTLLGSSLRWAGTLVLNPSQDIRPIAKRHRGSLPRAMRILMRSLGVMGGDGRMESYLMFEPEYVSDLIALGYGDTMARRDEVAGFLAG